MTWHHPHDLQYVSTSSAIVGHQNQRWTYSNIFLGLKCPKVSWVASTIMPRMLHPSCIPLGTHTTLCSALFLVQRRFFLFSNLLWCSIFCHMLRKNESSSYHFPSKDNKFLTVGRVIKPSVSLGVSLFSLSSCVSLSRGSSLSLC